MASLRCHHDIALAQVHRDGESAWCYLCEAEVPVIGWRENEDPLDEAG